MKFLILIFTTLAFAGSSFTPGMGGGTTTMPIGTILEYAGAALPAGGAWLYADGSCISSADYPAYAAIASDFTRGDCATGQIQLPDRRGTFARGWVPDVIKNQVSNTIASSRITFAGGHAFRSGMRVKVDDATGLTGASIGSVYYARARGTYINLCPTRIAAGNAQGTGCLTITASSITISQAESPNARQLPAGNTGTGLGTIQESANLSHSHGLNISNGSGSSQTILGSGFAGNVTQSTLPDGALESRPSNIEMSYIIRVR